MRQADRAATGRAGCSVCAIIHQCSRLSGWLWRKSGCEFTTYLSVYIVEPVTRTFVRFSGPRTVAEAPADRRIKDWICTWCRAFKRELLTTIQRKMFVYFYKAMNWNASPRSWVNHLAVIDESKKIHTHFITVKTFTNPHQTASYMTDLYVGVVNTLQHKEIVKQKCATLESKIQECEKRFRKEEDRALDWGSMASRDWR